MRAPGNYRPSWDSRCRPAIGRAWNGSGPVLAPSLCTLPGSDRLALRRLVKVHTLAGSAQVADQCLGGWLRHADQQCQIVKAAGRLTQGIVAPRPSWSSIGLSIDLPSLGALLAGDAVDRGVTELLSGELLPSLASQRSQLSSSWTAPLSRPQSEREGSYIYLGGCRIQPMRLINGTTLVPHMASIRSATRWAAARRSSSS